MVKRNVLQLVHGFIEGGSERQLIQMAGLLHQSGHYNVYVGSLSAGGVLRGEVERLQIPIVDFPLTSFYDGNMVVQTRRFASFLKQNAIEIVHSHDFYSNVFGMSGSAVARVGGRIASKRETTGTRTGAQSTVERGAFRLARAIVANAEAVKAHLIAEGVPSSKIDVVYNGIDLQRFGTIGDTGEILRTLNLPAVVGRPVITMVANFEYEVKDHPMFLRAARRVLSEIPDAAFVIAGEGILKAQAQQVAHELEIAGSCFFIGRCATVPDLLAASNICVLSSQAEGFSNSILEYMAAARPVVATNVGGASEAIVEGHNGYLVSTGDDEAMAQKIISLIREPNHARTLGINGRRDVEEKFSCAARLSKTAALYERVLT
jgi:glycosyltransferase involved in cell wall biosynthesis